MLYKIVRHQRLSDFEEAVEWLLNDGWYLQGGVSIGGRDSNWYFYAQAMTKPENPLRVRAESEQVGSEERTTTDPARVTG